MDAIFAILVLGAVIFFGALISAGNERQRKAIDGIREQAAQWAMQDLRLKREHLSKDVKVDNPVAWLNKIITKVYGKNFELTLAGVFDNPPALVCIEKDGEKVIFSPMAPDDIQRSFNKTKGRLFQIANDHPLLNISSKSQPIKISILNAGVLFDLELPVAWNKLSGMDGNGMESLWLYPKGSVKQR